MPATGGSSGGRTTSSSTAPGASGSPISARPGADADRGAVYYAKADGSSIKEAIFPLERPNGIGLSPDEKTLYVVETPTARCWSFRLSAPGQIESANGPYRGEKGKVVVGLGGYQMFDSLAVDGEGHVCVATLITGAVNDIWPDGSRVDQFMLPDMMVTNVCFGGRDSAPRSPRSRWAVPSCRSSGRGPAWR